MSIETACRAIIDGYAKGYSGTDAPMIDHVLELADHAKEILEMEQERKAKAPRPIVRSAPIPPRAVRLTMKDKLGNTYYLIVGERIYLTNPGQVPLAMSNVFSDAAKCEFALADSRGSVAALIAIANRYSHYEWSELRL